MNNEQQEGKHIDDFYRKNKIKNKTKNKYTEDKQGSFNFYAHTIHKKVPMIWIH